MTAPAAVGIDPGKPKKKRRKMGVSPTARSLAWLRSFGWAAQVVEQTLPRCFIKKDLFGLADIVALDGKTGVLMVQATTESHLGDHIAKAEGIAHLRTIIEAGNRFEIHVYGERKIAPQRGVKRTKAAAVKYEMRRVAAYLDGTTVRWTEVEA